MNKILVIDDDEAINELLKINLELFGYPVITAKNGIEGFALVKQELPDLVIRSEERRVGKECRSRWSPYH